MGPKNYFLVYHMQKQPSRGPEVLTEVSPWKHKKDGKKAKVWFIK